MIFTRMPWPFIKIPSQTLGALNLEEGPMQTLIDDDKLKQLLKEALIEAIEEKRNLFSGMIADAVEDIAMVRAIQEGENTETISKKEIFNILDAQS